MTEIKTWAIYRSEKKKLKRLNKFLEDFLLNQISSDKYRKIALDELITHNVNLVHHIAKRYRWCNVPYEDLITSGIEGIISAADNFDFSKGVRFGTIATHYILGRIRRIIDHENNVIRKPSHINMITQQINKFDEEEITESQLQSLAGDRFSYNQIKVANEHKHQTTVNIEDYLDIPIFMDNTIEIRALVEDYMHILTTKEKLAINLKFGLDGSEPMTYKDLDKELGCDSECVVNRSLKKIRESFNEPY
jgi:RNA polymerase sigma factor (sigma-70 family)